MKITAIPAGDGAGTPASGNTRPASSGRPESRRPASASASTSPSASASTSASPRVLHVIHSLRCGGLERILIAVANGLSRRGCPQAICCQHERGALGDAVEAEVDQFVLGAGANDPRTPFRLRRLIRQWRPDVVHSEDFSVWGECAAALAYRGSPAHMHTFHGFLDTPPRRWRGLGCVLGAMTDALHAVSVGVAREVSDTFSIPIDRVGLLRNRQPPARYL